MCSTEHHTIFGKFAPRFRSGDFDPLKMADV